MSALRSSVPAAAFALFAAACGDDVLKPNSELTRDEARALFENILTLQTGGTDRLRWEPGHVVVPCPREGRAEVVGTVRGVWHGGGETWWSEIVITPQGCRLTIDDETHTIDGVPSLHVLLRAEMDTNPVGPIDLTGQMEREVKWRSEGRSGICTIDVVLRAGLDRTDPQAPKSEGGYTGSACGHEMVVGWDPEWTFYCHGDPVCSEDEVRESPYEH